MTRKILIALVFMALLFCPAVVSAGSSDICFSLGDSEEGRYVFLFQKDGFNQYLDRTSMEDRGDHLLATIVAIPEAACNDPGNMERYVGVFGFRKSGEEGAVFSVERYSEDGSLLEYQNTEVENPTWEKIPPGHPVHDLLQSVMQYIQIQ